MNFTRFCSRLSRSLFTNLNRTTSAKISLVQASKLVHSASNSSYNHFQSVTGISSVLVGFSLFGRSDDKETPEDKMIMTIKRSILCIQREEYDKAEKMLHLALRMAQDQQSKEGITFVYDLMANLAMQREQFTKAEKLFTDVMRRLLSDGHSDDSMQMLHISAKIAHMAQMQGHIDKALQGFTWTLNKIEEKLRSAADDSGEIKELLGLTKNWFGELLMEQGKFQEAKKHFLEALDIWTEFHGKVNEEAMLILNNISAACANLEEIPEARRFLEEALAIAKEFPDMAEEGVLKANLGLLYLKEGLMQQAKEVCSVAWRWGKKTENEDAVQQAEYCLEKIKELMK